MNFVVHVEIWKPRQEMNVDPNKIDRFAGLMQQRGLLGPMVALNPSHLGATVGVDREDDDLSEAKLDAWILFNECFNEVWPEYQTYTKRWNIQGHPASEECTCVGYSN
jgi:hypothetical protein